MLSIFSTKFGKSNFKNSIGQTDESIWIPIGIFLLFLTYGPSVEIVGQLRITEIILILIGLFNFKKIMQSLGRNEIFIAFLLLLTALSYGFFDIFNQGITHTTIKRVGSYCILSALFLIITWMVNKNKNRMLAATVGFAFSFVIVWLFNITIPNNIFHATPWRLGLGESLTVVALCLPAINQRYKFISAVIFFIVVSIHLFTGSRNLSLLSFTLIFLFIFSQFFGDTKAHEFTWHKFTKLASGIVAGLCAVFAVFIFLVGSNVLPEDVERRLTRQFDSKYGVIISARPDVSASILGIAKRPFTGYGSGVVDDDVYQNYAKFISGDNPRHFRRLINEKPLWEASPSHSHVFGAWLDAGFIAAISWIFILIFCARYVVILSYLQHPMVPLGLFYLLSMIWDILFSPGPNRVEMSIGLTFLFFIMKYLRQESQIDRHN